jgi:2-dehydro-3-deoxyphosphogluconate aldolase/(4S)-4-hydroxy-2-oxoglutarate aldolase
MSALEVLLKASPVIAVVTVDRDMDGPPLAQALVSGWAPLIEVTLRTRAGLEAIRAISSQVPDAIVGAGTVLTPEDLRAAADAGARYALSPGLTPKLAAAAQSSKIPFIPGVATASEIMLGLEAGFEVFKFFPAEFLGGVSALRALEGPLAKAKFIPTGGVTIQNASAYLRLGNVLNVGGSWLAPPDLIAAKAWGDITIRAKAARALRP